MANLQMFNPKNPTSRPIDDGCGIHAANTHSQILGQAMTGLEAKLRTLPEDIMGEARNLFVIQKSKRATMQHMGEVFALRDQLNLRSAAVLHEHPYMDAHTPIDMHRFPFLDAFSIHLRTDILNLLRAICLSNSHKVLIEPPPPPQDNQYFVDDIHARRGNFEVA